MFEMGGGPLTEDNLQNIILDAGKHPVLEVPKDLSAISSELSISCKLIEESVLSGSMDID